MGNTAPTRLTRGQMIRSQALHSAIRYWHIEVDDIPTEKTVLVTAEKFANYINGFRLDPDAEDEEDDDE